MKPQISFGSDRQIAYSLCCGLFGYAISWVFVYFGLMGPRQGQEGFVLATLIGGFELYAFLILALFGPLAVGFGWAFIFVLASYRKRRTVLILLFAMAIISYVVTSRELGHAITFTDLNLQKFRSEKMIEIFVFFGTPLIICLGALAFILIKRIKKIHG